MPVVKRGTLTTRDSRPFSSSVTRIVSALDDSAVRNGGNAMKRCSRNRNKSPNDEALAANRRRLLTSSGRRQRSRRANSTLITMFKNGLHPHPRISTLFPAQAGAEQDAKEAGMGGGARVVVVGLIGEVRLLASSNDLHTTAMCRPITAKPVLPIIY